MKKIFTRRELLHNGLISIRASLGCAQGYKKEGDFKSALFFYHCARTEISMLHNMHLISDDRWKFLGRMVQEMYSNF